MTTYMQSFELEITIEELPSTVIPGTILSTGHTVSMHFIERWVERLPDSWARFNKLLELQAYRLMCSDTSRRDHLLFRSILKDQFYVVIMGPNNCLVTVLDEDIYRKQLNAASIDSNKSATVQRLMASSCLVTSSMSKSRNVLYLNAQYTGGHLLEKVLWLDLCELDDIFAIEANFEYLIRKIMETGPLVELVYKAIKEKQIYSVINVHEANISFLGKRIDVSEYFIKDAKI